MLFRVTFIFLNKVFNITFENEYFFLELETKLQRKQKYTFVQRKKNKVANL